MSQANSGELTLVKDMASHHKKFKPETMAFFKKEDIEMLVSSYNSNRISIQT